MGKVQQCAVDADQMKIFEFSPIENAVSLRISLSVTADIARSSAQYLRAQHTNLQRCVEVTQVRPCKLPIL